MGRRGVLAVVVLTVALAVTSGGWYLSANAGHEGNFSSCRFEGDTLVLTYMYGSNSMVLPTFDTRGEDLVVSPNTRQGSGMSTMEGIFGEARFGARAGATVRYPDGRKLDCDA